MRLGIIGIGRIGTEHARHLATREDVDEVIVVDADAGRSAALAEALGVSPAPDLDALFAARPDGVVIATPTVSHVPLIRLALDRGVPVFCEKPVALAASDVEAVTAYAGLARVPLQIGYQRRFDGVYRKVRRRVRQGQLGDLYALRLVSLDADPPPAGYLPTSGGIFFDLHVHDFDLVRWLTGEEVRQVFAVGSRRGPANAEGWDDEYDTTAITLILESGALTTISGARHNVPGYDSRIELSGSRGSLTAGLTDTSPVCPVENGIDWPRGVPSRDFIDRFTEAYAAEMDAFVALVAGSGPNECTGYDAVSALRVAEAARESARSGLAVDVRRVVSATDPRHIRSERGAS